MTTPVRDGEFWYPSCPVCGELIDYCQGHGEIGDPEGWRILQAHDDGEHDECHPAGCENVCWGCSSRSPYAIDHRDGMWCGIP